MSKQKGVSFIYLLHTNHEIIGKPQNTSLTKTRSTRDNTSLLATWPNASHMWPLIWFEQNVHISLRSITSSIYESNKRNLSLC
jgi:hypothetical protein